MIAEATTPKRLKSLASTFDWMLLLLVTGIATIGILNLTSAAGVLTQPLHVVQLIWFGFGIIFFAVPCAIIDYRAFERWAYLFYGLVNFALLLVLLVGRELNGSKRWLDLGFFHFQPSEVMKVALVIVVAKFLAEREKAQGYTILDLAPLMALLALPVVLILKEPDLGTASLLALITFSMVFFEGLKRSTIVLLVLAGIAITPIAWMSMKSYQQDRIRAFLQLEEDPYGRDWQVKNSVIAVGAGGLWGRGFGKGTQVQKGFVPEPENDFAMANWAEEHGFAGAAGLLALYLALILWTLRIARQARDRFGMLVAVGIATIVFWQVIVNTGMVVRWALVVGITLPFVSYGGSSVVTLLICVGILMSISLRRHSYRG